ncbi:MAG: hypothetical protein WEE03_09265 [Chloroflexota bacterium]
MTFSRLIRFDKRGTGMSDRPKTVATLEERTDDIRAILDSLKSEGIPDPRQVLTVAQA